MFNQNREQMGTLSVEGGFMFLVLIVGGAGNSGLEKGYAGA
jgi:hypothetical protein